MGIIHVRSRQGQTYKKMYNSEFQREMELRMLCFMVSLPNYQWQILNGIQRGIHACQTNSFVCMRDWVDMLLFEKGILKQIGLTVNEEIVRGGYNCKNKNNKTKHS